MTFDNLTTKITTYNHSNPFFPAKFTPLETILHRQAFKEQKEICRQKVIAFLEILDE